MRFLLDYSSGKLEKEDPLTRSPAEQAANEFIKHYTDRFEIKRQLSFYGVMTYVNLMAATQCGIFEYSIDESENTESFRLSIPKISSDEKDYSVQAITNAAEHFSEIKISTENGGFVLRGTRPLS